MGTRSSSMLWLHAFLAGGKRTSIRAGEPSWQPLSLQASVHTLQAHAELIPTYSAIMSVRKCSGAHLAQVSYCGASSSIKAEALLECLLQPGGQAAGNLRSTTLQKCRQRLVVGETLVRQLSCGQMQDTGGKAPYISMSSPGTTISICLLWSPASTHTHRLTMCTHTATRLPR